MLSRDSSAPGAPSPAGRRSVGAAASARPVSSAGGPEPESRRPTARPAAPLGAAGEPRGGAEARGEPALHPWRARLGAHGDGCFEARIPSFGGAS